MTAFSAALIENLSTLEDTLKYRFKNPALLMQALAHASLGAEVSNERLEFLGDRVLGLVIAERLYGDHPNVAEGGLAVRLNALVRRDACARVAEAAGLSAHLTMTASEAGTGGRQKAAILAGACEAVIAALYLDGGLEAARAFILYYWKDALASFPGEMRDAKTALQEWAQSGALKEKVQPAYELTGRTGPDHAPVFRISVSLPGHASEIGEGQTKRDAEQDAARRMLIKCGVWQNDE